MLTELAFYRDGMLGIPLDDFEAELPEEYTLESGEVYLNYEQPGEKLINQFTEGDDWLFIESDNLMQFTTFQDKEKTKIFDGDIIGERDPLKKGKPAYPVMWDNIEGCWAIDMSAHKDASILQPLARELNANFGRYVVLGNIHQHQHLLQ